MGVREAVRPCEALAMSADRIKVSGTFQHPGSNCCVQSNRGMWLSDEVVTKCLKKERLSAMGKRGTGIYYSETQSSCRRVVVRRGGNTDWKYSVSSVSPILSFNDVVM